MRLSAGRRRESHAETFLSLDAVLFSLAGAALAWEFLMIPVLDQGTDRLTLITSLAYPMGDLLLLGGLASLGLSASRALAAEGYDVDSRVGRGDARRPTSPTLA